MVVQGDIGDVLTEESRRAELICVGSFGVNYPSRKLLGSVADAVVQSAHCPVHPVALYTSHPVALYMSRAKFLTETDQSVPLAIVDTAGGDEHNPVIGPPVVSRAYCSVIVVRPEQCRWSAERSRSVNGPPTREMAQ
jgi:hypothetical protein